MLGVNNANDVTAAQLAAITYLHLEKKNITSLKASDFNGLTSLEQIVMWRNSLTDLSALAGLTSLKYLLVDNNPLTDLSALENLTKLEWLNLSVVSDSSMSNSLTDLSALADLPSLTHLYLHDRSFTDLSALAGLTSLTTLALSDNSISVIPDIADLTKMKNLYLYENSISDISTLENLTALRFIDLSDNSVSNISAIENLTALTNLKLKGNSISDYGPLRRLIAAIKAIEDHPGLKYDINIPPEFTDGTSATRSIAENTASGQNIGTVIAATDVDANTTLTYTLSGDDASSFSIVSTSGQLQTKAALDYETKTSYSVTVSVSDGNGGSDSITVTINVTDVAENRAPAFTDGTSTKRLIAENTASDTDIGTAVGATDADSDTLTYTLGGTDKASFSIDSTSGQLQTSAALDYETATSYSVKVSVSDGNGGTDSITVTINVTDVDKNRAPSFTDGANTTRSVAEYTASGQDIGSAVTATDADSDTLTYTLGGTDKDSFSIVSTTGQLQTSAALDYETKASYSVKITVSDSKLTDTITVTINVTDVSEIPTPPVNQRTQQVRDAIVDAVPGVDNANDVTVVQLAEITTLNLSSKGITALKSGDFNGLTELTRLNMDDNSVSDISALEHLTALTDLYLDDNSISDISALEHLTALTDLYLDDNSVSDISALEHLTKLTRLNLRNNSVSDISALEHLTKLTHLYLRGNPISDYGPLRRLKTAIENAGNSIYIDIDITNNNLPTFTDGDSTTRAVPENTAAGQNIGTAVAATDADGHTLTYTLGGTDKDSFDIVSTSGQLQTKAALDYEAKSSYTVTVTANDGNGGGDKITVTIRVTNVNETRITAVNRRTQQVQDAIVAAVPGVDNADDVTATHLAAITELDISSESITALKSGDFSGLPELTTLNLSDNAITNISPISDLPKLTTLNLSDNAISNIWSLRSLPKLTTLDLSDNAITNVWPLERFTTLTTLNLNGNSISDYRPLRRLIAAIEDIEDHPGLTLDLNIPPVFTDGTSATRSVAEYTPPGQDIGTAVSATDANGHTLTYTLGGDDAASFDIVSTSGQLQTKAELHYETKASYSVTVSVSDGNSGTDSITVRINITNVIESLITPVNQRTKQVQDEIVAAVPNVNNADDVTPAHLAAITGLNLDYNDITALKSGDFSGLTSLKTLYMGYNSISNISALRGLTSLKTLYMGYNSISNIWPLRSLTSLTTLDLRNNSITNISALEGLTSLTTLYLDGNSISEYGPLRRLIAAIDDIEEHPGLTLDLNIPPVFDGTSTTRSVAEYTPSGQDIGDAVSATDANGDTLTYTLSGTDKDSFSIVSDSGQLQTSAALNYQTKTSYSVIVSVSDGSDDTDSITVTINVTDVDESSITPVNQRTEQVKDAIVDAVPGVDNANDVTVAQLAAITELSLGYIDITALKAGDFSGLASLTRLDLSGNSISDISPLKGLTKLTHLEMNYNSISDISPLRGLTKLIELSLSYNSISDVSALENLTALRSLSLSANPISDYGPLRRLEAAIEDPYDSIYIDIDMTNIPPVFTDGDRTTRSVAENTEPGQYIGAAVRATDADDEGNNALTYTLSGTDADAFDIVSASGRLQTKAPLDYETKRSYTVIVIVNDGNSGGDKITVTINVTDVAGAAPSVEVSPMIPEKTELLTNFPNPFNPETWIPYQLAKPAEVTLTIYDIRGVVVRELKLGHQAAGIYHSRSRAIHWDGRNAFGEKVATGIYFYTLKAGDFNATRKLLIRK